MKFCSDCGAALVDHVPPGDDRARRWCAACGKAHYQNPVVVVGCLVERGDEVLLCRRAIEPARGRWTIPAGFLELGETMAAGAARETWEEARAAVEITAPHSHLELTHIGQVHVSFRARLTTDAFAPGPESLECAFFAEPDVPWREMAFPASVFALRLLFRDRAEGAAHLHQGNLQWSGQGSRFDPDNYVIEELRRAPLG